MNASNNPDLGSDRWGRGLTLRFYRNADLGDCTNGGISSRFTRCVLVGIVDYSHRRVCGEPEVRPVSKYARVFEPSEDSPPVWLVRDQAFRGTWHLIPGDPQTGKPDRGRWWMFGGNYANTSDSRLRELMDDQWFGAIPVHDRHESSR